MVHGEPVPWESCVTVGHSFSFAYGDTYKSQRELVHLLTDVVALGGNLALNIGPQSDGRLPPQGIEAIKSLGAWLKVNGEAIYGARLLAPYKHGPLRYTRNPKTGKSYVIIQYEQGARPEKTTLIPYKDPIMEIKYVATGETCSFNRDNSSIKLNLPASALMEPDPVAQVFEIT
jgi:alpha-L-fucosidase